MHHLSSAGGDDAPGDSRLTDRLDSWKEIAAHFGRDTRTVRRWERTEGLPVHRHLHVARGSVYAYRDELNQWLEGRSARQRLLEPSQEPPQQPTAGLPTDSAPATSRRPRLSTRAWVMLVAAASLVVAALAFVLRGDAAVPAPVETSRTGSGSEALAARSGQWLDDPKVREAFLVARHQLSRRTGYRQVAREQLERLVQQAPGFADAHGLLGEAYLRQALYDQPSGREAAWAKAEAAARRALALDEGVALGHTTLGRILLLRDWDLASARAELASALDLDPNDLEARSALALCDRAAGRSDAALAERRRVQQLDPLSPQWLVFLGDEYLFARQYGEAERAYRRALELERDYRPAVLSMADVLARAGRFAEAAVWQLRYLRLTGRHALAAGYDDVCQREGPAEAERWLHRQRLVGYQREAEGHAWDLAYTYARLGERDEAMRCLEIAFARRDYGLLQARVDPDLDFLRSDPRFVDLLERMGPSR